ncbi:hypothetical protein VP01_62g3 [Puccinia sorghi]|uniref:Uncharacterized protein n=1 Tax=Puccinia sorghi TaxID=27349 RepID=A0A0L6UGB2_9BASI|nr:hypothetical protein VP01_62g3 [Puccinia sorghi]
MRYLLIDLKTFTFFGFEICCDFSYTFFGNLWILSYLIPPILHASYLCCVMLLFLCFCPDKLCHFEGGPFLGPLRGFLNQNYLCAHNGFVGLSYSAGVSTTGGLSPASSPWYIPQLAIYNLACNIFSPFSCFLMSHLITDCPSYCVCKGARMATFWMKLLSLVAQLSLPGVVIFIYSMAQITLTHHIQNYHNLTGSRTPLSTHTNLPTISSMSAIMSLSAFQTGLDNFFNMGAVGASLEAVVGGGGQLDHEETSQLKIQTLSRSWNQPWSSHLVAIKFPALSKIILWEGGGSFCVSVTAYRGRALKCSVSPNLLSNLLHPHTPHSDLHPHTIINSALSPNLTHPFLVVSLLHSSSLFCLSVSQLTSPCLVRPFSPFLLHINSCTNLNQSSLSLSMILHFPVLFMLLYPVKFVDISSPFSFLSESHSNIFFLQHYPEEQVALVVYSFVIWLLF